MNMYIDFFASLLIAVTFIHGFAFTFNEGEIFVAIGKWMYEKFPDYVNKPLWLCEFCMSSVHGTWVFIVFLWGYPLYLWVLFCFCLCGVTAIINK
jgi:hypothetical protein